MLFPPYHTRRFQGEFLISFPDLLITLFVTDLNRGWYDGFKVWLIRRRDGLWTQGIFLCSSIARFCGCLNYYY
jgi:hypothetical protein